MYKNVDLIKKRKERLLHPLHLKYSLLHHQSLNVFVDRLFQPLLILTKTFIPGILHPGLDSQECLTFLNEQWHTIDVSKLDAPSKNALLFFCAKFDLDAIMIDLIIESIDLDVSLSMNYNFFGSTSTLVEKHHHKW